MPPLEGWAEDRNLLWRMRRNQSGRREPVGDRAAFLGMNVCENVNLLTIMMTMRMSLLTGIYGTDQSEWMLACEEVPQVLREGHHITTCWRWCWWVWGRQELGEAAIYHPVWEFPTF